MALFWKRNLRFHGFWFHDLSLRALHETKKPVNMVSWFHDLSPSVDSGNLKQHRKFCRGGGGEEEGLGLEYSSSWMKGFELYWWFYVDNRPTGWISSNLPLKDEMSFSINAKYFRNKDLLPREITACPLTEGSRWQNMCRYCPITALSIFSNKRSFHGIFSFVFVSILRKQLEGS